MERVPIGFELPPAEKKDDEIVEIVPQKIEGVSMAPEIPKTEQAPAMPPEMPKEEAAAEHVVEPPLQKEAAGEEGAENGERPQNQSEKPVRNLNEVVKLFQDAEAIKERELDGEFSGEGRASRLRWENAFDEFARNPDFSSFANNPDTKKRLEDVLEEYKKYQEIEDRSKTDTGHIYTETDIQTINKARTAVRGYLEARVKEKNAVAAETGSESRKKAHEIVGVSVERSEHEEVAKESPPPPDNLPVMEGAARERGELNEAVVDKTVSEISELVKRKREEKSREKTPKRAKVTDLAEERKRRGLKEGPVDSGAHSEKGGGGKLYGKEKEAFVNPDNPDDKKLNELLEESRRAFQPKVGDTLRIPSNEQGVFIESGWRVDSVKRNSKDSEVESIVVVKEINGKVIKRAVDGFVAWNLNRVLADSGNLRILDSVRVQRSSGKIEGGWVIAGYDPLQKIAAVHNEQGLKKEIPIAELEALNTEADEKDEVTPEEKGERVFEIGKRVRIRRSDGTTEENWMVGPKDEKTGRIRVMREDGELVKHVTPEDLAEWNGGSKQDESLGEAIRERGKEIHASAEGARTPYEFLSDRAKALFEKLGDEVKERVRGVYERAKFNTIDHAAVLYDNMLYDYHEKYIRANNVEIAAIDREINERRGMILRSKEMRAEGGAVSGRLRRKSEGAVLKSEAGIQKLIARKEILKSRVESRNARQSLFETRRQNILEKVSEHTSEALRPHDRRMERIRQEMKGVEEIIARFSQERKKIQDKISQLEREQENAPRANRRILRAMAAEQKFALKGRDKLIAEQRGKLNALAKKQAAVDKKAQPWRETSARFKNLVGKK